MNAFSIIAPAVRASKTAFRTDRLVLEALALAAHVLSVAVAHVHLVIVRELSALARLLIPSPVLAHLDAQSGITMYSCCLLAMITIWIVIGVSLMDIWLLLPPSILRDAAIISTSIMTAHHVTPLPQYQMLLAEAGLDSTVTSVSHFLASPLLLIPFAPATSNAQVLQILAKSPQEHALVVLVSPLINQMASLAVEV
jgi:hypothetical protein